jgi:uncharacterized protein YaiI (UPF0178 family)
MRILVDSDSMPRPVREIVIRNARRRRVVACFFSSAPVKIPESEWVSHERVPDADQAILDTCRPDDLVISRDIPLAARLVAMGLAVLNDRGDLFTVENVAERLSIRDAAKDIRDAGLEKPRGRTYSSRQVQLFANALDRELTRRGVAHRGSEPADRPRQAGAAHRAPGCGLDNDKPD